MINQSLLILYVSDQKAATEFYKAVLEKVPSMDVQGMTEFNLRTDIRLGLMPLAGAKKLLGSGKFPPGAKDVPKAELYLLVDDADSYLMRAVESGAELIHHVEPRDWGDRVGYCFDPDGHVLAFAEAL